MGTGLNWIETLRSSPTLMALVVFSVVTLAIALERSYYYFWKRAGSPDHVVAQAVRALRHGNVGEAARLCASSNHPMGPVAAQVLESGAVREEEAEEQLQIALSEQKLLLERNLGILGTMAAVSPLMGLLGTVWGIMRAFSDMALAGSGSPSVVAAGVAEALITTAVGITVAVPALIMYNLFARRMNVMLTLAENHTRSLRAVYVSALNGGPDPEISRESARPGRREKAADYRAQTAQRAEDELDLVR